MRKPDGTARRGQVLYNFGPGAIVDFRTSDGATISVINSSIDRWEEEFLENNKIRRSLIIREARLEKKLLVNNFITPPINSEDHQEGDASNSQGNLVGIRFPKNLQCPVCNEIKRYDKWEQNKIEDPARFCAKCSSQDKKSYVIPSRFLIACTDGHLDEFPWDTFFYKIKHKKKDCKKKYGLEQKSTIGLSGLRLKCIDCESYYSFENIFTKEISKELACNGRHLWKSTSSEICKLSPRVIQRGASNAYFPVTVTVISIPPFSYQFKRKLPSAYIRTLRKKNKKVRIEELYDLKEEGWLNNISPEKMNSILERFYEAEEKADMNNLKYDEYTTLVESDKDYENSPEYDYQANIVDLNSSLNRYITKIIKVSRLREVRAIRGFTRIFPSASPFKRGKSKINELSKNKLNWLPAIENKGEGIFIELNRQNINSFFKDSFYESRILEIKESFTNDFKVKNPNEEIPVEINIPFILAHGLSHALIRELSITCGYSTSSIKERIYSDENGKEMCGILIYTSSSDSDGTLGGLSRIAEEDRFTEIFINAIKNIEFCSSDPICSTNKSSLKDDFILSSCNSCLLLPETSCEYFNYYLDRLLLVNRNQNDKPGFFNGLLEIE